MYAIGWVLNMENMLTIGIDSCIGAVWMRHNRHDMLDGEVQHVDNCWLRFVKRYHTLERNSAIALGSLYSERTETFPFFGSLYFVENVLIVLGRVEEVAVYGVDLESRIEILDRIQGRCQCLPYDLTSKDSSCPSKCGITSSTIVKLINH